MANLPPPKKKEQGSQPKAATPVVKAVKTSPTDTPPPDSIKPLQLKIPETDKNEFKAYAASIGRPMNALFLDMFQEYKERH